MSETWRQETEARLHPITPARVDHISPHDFFDLCRLIVATDYQPGGELLRAVRSRIHTASSIRAYLSDEVNSDFNQILAAG